MTFFEIRVRELQRWIRYYEQKEIAQEIILNILTGAYDEDEESGGVFH